MAYKPQKLNVIEGGTGDISLAAYAVLCGGTTSTNPIQSVSGLGSSAQILISNDASALPTWQTATAGIGYAFNLQTSNNGGAPADSTTYFLNDGLITSITTTDHAGTRFTVPKTGTVKSIVGSVTVAGTLGTTENTTVSLYVNGSSTATVTSTLKMSAVSNAFSNTSMSTAVTAGDYLSLAFATPAWATNPNGVAIAATIYIE